MRRIGFTVILLVSLSAPAWADFEEGFAAFERGDYATAYREYLPLAEAGMPEAQSNLGLMYYNGQGVPQDYAVAVRWFRAAAEQGLADAQNNLGIMYGNGEGVPQDYAEAVRLYRLAAGQGYAEAQFNLGTMYDNGQGVPQDYAEAVKWYRKAAEQGLAVAQHNLGVTYGNGEGVPQDYAEAVRWFRRAAEQGYAQAQNNLGAMYMGGEGVPRDLVQAHMWFNLAAATLPPGEDRDMAVENRDLVAEQLSPSELARAQEMARNWRPDITDAGREISSPTLPAVTPELVQNVQESLAALGYDPGPADEVLSPKTRAAIRAFEADQGLPVTGEVSDVLVAQLATAMLASFNSISGTADELRDLPEMSAWVAEVQAIYHELTRVIDYAVQVDDISAALIDGEISEDFALRNGRSFFLQARLSYDKVSERIDCCLPQPKVEKEQFVKAARNVSQYLRTLRDQVLNIIEATEATFNAAIDGDVDTVNRLQLKQLEQVIILVESENVLLKTQTLLAKESHPQHPFFLSVIAGNRATLAALSYLRDFASGRLSVADVNAARFLVERELLNMERAIDDGRQAILNWRIQISDMRRETERERRMVTLLTQLFDSYKESFDVEEQLASTIFLMANAVLADDFVNAPLELYETEMLKLEVLVDRRVQLQSERHRIVGEIGTL